MLMEVVQDPGNPASELAVRFAFERFSDYFIADGVVATYSDSTAFKAALLPGAPLAWLRTGSGYFRNRGVARALSILVPEHYKIELSDLLVDGSEDAERARWAFVSDFLDSLAWRSWASFNLRTRELLREASAEHLDGVLETLLRVASILGHPFNADFLHERLNAMDLPTREQIWTIPISQAGGDPASMPATLVDWALRVRLDLVSDEQAFLVATVLLWFGSSTRVGFRARAAHAAIRLLIGRPEVTVRLIERFDKVDDPYVVERLYAVACGVAMREPAGEDLRRLARTVHRLVLPVTRFGRMFCSAIMRRRSSASPSGGVASTPG